MSLWGKVRGLWTTTPRNIIVGKDGENAARAHLEKAGLKFLMANYATRRGEIDLICRDQDCLVFVEVKTRASEEWSRPAAAVTQKKRQKLFRAALEYLRLLEDPRVKIRFDIVEVLVRGGEKEIRHLPNAFSMRGRSMYGSGEPGPRRPGSR